MNPTIPDNGKFVINTNDMGGRVETTKYFVDNLSTRPIKFDEYQTMTLSHDEGSCKDPNHNHGKHPTTTVPEPATYVLVVLGLAAVLVVKKIF